MGWGETTRKAHAARCRPGSEAPRRSSLALGLVDRAPVEGRVIVLRGAHPGLGLVARLGNVLLAVGGERAGEAALGVVGEALNVAGGVAPDGDELACHRPAVAGPHGAVPAGGRISAGGEGGGEEELYKRGTDMLSIIDTGTSFA